MSSTSGPAFIASLDKVNGDSFATKLERAEALQAAKALVRRLETPWDLGRELIWDTPILFAAIKTLSDRDVFNWWAAQKRDAVTLDEVAKGTNFDPALLQRFFNCLVGFHLLTVDADHRYRRTPFVNLMGEPETGLAAGFRHGEYCNLPVFQSLPKFLKSTDYRNPVDPTHSNWQFMTGRSTSCFEDLGSDPEAFQDFQAVIGGSRAAIASWVDYFPTDQLFAGAKGDRPVLVDVGGGRGFDLSSLARKHPDAAQGSLVLQDLPDTVAAISLPKPMTAQGYDFFTPQPITGARAYFLHNILHDWADGKAVEILRQIAAALEPGYSRVLLNEIVVDPQRPTATSTVYDVTMMALFSAKERTLADWTALLHSVGLKIVHVHSSPEAAECVIEAEKA